MAGVGQCCELPPCCGEWRAAHLMGKNPNLPEATGNRVGLGEGQRLPGQSRALHGTTGLSQSRLEAKALQGVSRHQLLCAAQTNLSVAR